MATGSKPEAKLEVSDSGVEQTPEPAAAEYPQTLTNRDGDKRIVHTISQQVAAEYDGYAVKAPK